MGYNKVTLYGHQICDYLYMQNGAVDATKFKEVDSEPSEWNNNTLLFAKFNDDNLTAGDSELVESINGYEIRRKKCMDSYTEYIGTIKSNSQSNAKKYMIDYLAASNTPYIYYLYPSTDKTSDSGDIACAPFISETVNPNWRYWSLLVVDETDEENVFYLNKLFKFELNLTVDDMSNNAEISVISNFTKYPTVQYGSPNYWSGGLTALCGYITCQKSKYVETPNMINELKTLTSDLKRKFLKDPDGNVWEVKITSPIVISNENIDIKSVKISWAEVGEVTNISVINNPNLSTNCWLLTESGVPKPYINYIWDDEAKWNDSYVWTEND